MMKSIRHLLLGVATFFAATTLQAQDGSSQTRQAQFNLASNSVAISGYDAVSYFTGKPQKGNKQWAVAHQGVTYQFANAANKAAFLKTPNSYEPQYGGWCAYAMGNDGTKVEVDPETYKIVGGKLYLFYNRFFTNTLKSWNKNEAGLMRAADANWRKLYKPAA